MAQAGGSAGFVEPSLWIGAIIQPAARCSNPKSKAAADVGGDQAVGHAPVHRSDKLGAAAMHRDDDVGRQSLELCHRVIDIILRRRAEMKSAEDRMQLAEPGHRHGCLLSC